MIRAESVRQQDRKLHQVGEPLLTCTPCQMRYEHDTQYKDTTFFEKVFSCCLSSRLGGALCSPGTLGLASGERYTPEDEPELTPTEIYDANNPSSDLFLSSGPAAC